MVVEPSLRYPCICTSSCCILSHVYIPPLEAASAAGRVGTARHKSSRVAIVVFILWRRLGRLVAEQPPQMEIMERSLMPACGLRSQRYGRNKHSQRSPGWLIADQSGRGKSGARHSTSMRIFVETQFCTSTRSDGAAIASVHATPRMCPRYH